MRGEVMRGYLLIYFLFFSVLMGAEVERERVAQLYVATFDRAPEKAGLEYWVHDSNLDIDAIAMSFFDQNETKMRYPDSLPTEDFIRAVYRNLFDRVADEDGLKYWKEDIESGRVGRNVFLLAVINGALGDDRETMQNKREVGLYFADSGISDPRLAQKVMVNVDSDSESVVEAKRMIDDLLSGREVVERGSDIHEDYFLFDINGVGRAYKTDGCIYPDENSTFDYTIYSDNSVEISYFKDGSKKSFECTVDMLLTDTIAVDGEIEAYFTKDSTAYDKERGLYYKVDKIYNGKLVSVTDNGSRAVAVDRKGYTSNVDILHVWRREKMPYRPIKALHSDKNVIDYGDMRESERNYIYDVKSDLYAYKGEGCIFPIDPNTIFHFEIYFDNTMKISFKEGGKEYSNICALRERYKKISPRDRELEAPIIEGDIYFDPVTGEYFNAKHIFRGTITAIYNDGKSVNIKDIPGYNYGIYLSEALKKDPLQHPGVVKPQNPQDIAEGYIREGDRNSLYDFLYNGVAYKSDGLCTFPKNGDTIIHFMIGKKGDITISYTENATFLHSDCTLAHSYESVPLHNAKSMAAKDLGDGIYYDETSDRYYLCEHLHKGVIVATFNDGQTAYVKDSNGLYYWLPVYAVYRELSE